MNISFLMMVQILDTQPQGHFQNNHQKDTNVEMSTLMIRQ